MLMTLAQITSRATELAGGRLDWSPSDVSYYANVAVGYVSLAAGITHTPSEALAVSSTTSGGNRIGLPTDWDHGIALSIGIPNSWSTSTTASRDTTWKPLPKQSPAWADTFHGSTNGGEPEAHVEYATWLELVPSPDSAYSLQLRYMSKAPALTSSSATPALDEQWHWAVVLKTAELLELSRGNMEGVRLQNAAYESYISVLRLDQRKKLMDQRGVSLRYARGPR